MTCIIGMAHKGKVHIGADSAGVAGYSLQIRADEKVFRNGPFLMGFTTSFRMGQLLRYDFAPPEHPAGMDDMKFMVSRFIKATRDCFRDGGFLSKEKDREEGGSFLVGYRGTLYEIDSDYQVGRMADSVASVGCGSAIALGAMYATPGLPPRKRIENALRITSSLNIGVHPPFLIECV